MFLIEKAKQFATKAHEGQSRKYSGQPYIVHPAAVAAYVSDITSDEDMIAAAWLHDVVEDCGVSVETLEQEFNKRVANLVDELTNPSKGFPQLRRAERKALDRTHIANSSNDAKTIKAIDRIKNLMDLKGSPGDFKVLYANESLLLAEQLDGAVEFLVDELKSLCRRILNEG